MHEIFSGQNLFDNFRVKLVGPSRISSHSKGIKNEQNLSRIKT